MFKDNQYQFIHQRNDINYSLKAHVTNVVNLDSHFNHWACERYSLFTKNKNQIYRGVVVHAPWKLVELENIQMTDNFSTMLGLKLTSFGKMTYSRWQKVRFTPFQKV